MKYILALALWPAVILGADTVEETLDSSLSQSPKVTTLDGFRVESSLFNKIIGEGGIVEDHKTRMVLLSKPSYPMIGIEKDEDDIGSYGVAIFQKETGAPNVNVIDRNGDGTFDYLQFSVLSQNGDLLRDVYDFGMDGQNEVIIDFENKAQKIFYEGIWYESKAKENFILELEHKEMSINQAFEYFKKNH